MECLSQIGTDDLVMAVFRNCVEMAVAGLASQRSGAGCLILGKLWRVLWLVLSSPCWWQAGRPWAFAGGRISQGGVILHAPKGQCLLGVLSHFMIVSLADWFPLAVTCLTFRDLPRSGLSFLINN